MFAFLKNTKIGLRIVMALSLPAFGVLAFSGFAMIDKYQASAEMDKVAELGRVLPVISALVHEMQKERGMSAIFISFKGKNSSSNCRTGKQIRTRGAPPWRKH